MMKGGAFVFFLAENPEWNVNITYAVIILAIAVFLCVKSILDNRRATERLQRRIDDEWGRVPTEEYTPEKYRSLQFYYNQLEKDGTEIDSITWNDLDMDQIFMTMNNTGSAEGEEYLFALLHKLSFSEEELAERERVITFFSENRQKRRKVQEMMMRQGKERSVSIYEYIHLLHLLKRESNIKHYISLVLMIASIAMLLIQPLMGVFAIMVVGIYNSFAYYKRKSEIERYFTVVSHLIRMMDSLKELTKLDFPELARYTDSVKHNLAVFSGFRSGARIVAAKNPTGNLLESFIDYVRMLFHIDLIKFNNMLLVFDNHEKELTGLFETSGFLDAMIAAASFRELMKEWCVPELSGNTAPFIDAKDIYHPMLDKPVKASISEKNSVLITGSNASGKSTFIKTMAINAILAQTVHTVMAGSYRSVYFQVASSMALRDDIFQQESYYIVEIKSLKRIMDRISDKIPMLCFVDEVLRGTNTLERIAASTEILSDIASKNALCFAATHDIELTHILEKKYSNYHFQEQVMDNQVLFDYQLHPGRAVSKNAIKLLKMLGYDDAITTRAEHRALYFEEHGEWEEMGK